LLRLKRKIIFVTGLVEPACLNFIDEQHSNIAMISGWGSTDVIVRNTLTNEGSPWKLSHFLKTAYLVQDTENCMQQHLICAYSESLISACLG
jgi:hypothetical protein